MCGALAFYEIIYYKAAKRADSPILDAIKELELQRSYNIRPSQNLTALFNSDGIKPIHSVLELRHHFPPKPYGSTLKTISYCLDQDIGLEYETIDASSWQMALWNGSVTRLQNSPITFN